MGSTNWTSSGAYDNDENTLILHDRELARAYYAEWQRLWATVPLERVCNAVEVWLPVVMRDTSWLAKLAVTSQPRPKGIKSTDTPFLQTGRCQLC